MNFFDYIGIDENTFREKYINTRLVQSQVHPEFPLVILTYGRETVHESVWDDVTRKCRGIIIRTDTNEIVARPFEKFFNFGTTEVEGCTEESVEAITAMGNLPIVWEKMDGFLCTLYRWEGKNYIASKGSFTSPHAKWATHWIQNSAWQAWDSPTLTPVFEGICSSLRIVVDYGRREELVLLAVVNNETGEEWRPNLLQQCATGFNTKSAPLHDISWQHAQQNQYDETLKNAEGYVLTWYRDGQTPFRLKMKFIDYLRLHRMVTGVSPKRILEVLQNGWTTEMDGLLNESTPWFNKFVAKWKRIIENEYARIDENSRRIFADAKEVNRIKVGQRPYANMGEERKEWAHEFTREPNKEFSGVLFAMLDGKDIAPIIWKHIRNSNILKGRGPMVDAFNI